MLEYLWRHNSLLLTTARANFLNEKYPEVQYINAFIGHFFVGKARNNQKTIISVWWIVLKLCWLIARGVAIR